MKIRSILGAAFLMMCAAVHAQTPAQITIPTDTAVRIGKLANGLTYYIRHNNYPEHVASFYIAQRVGSIQELPSQRGLAHFLEHMAFNGSEHFPDDGIIKYTRGLGVSFGRDLNAYTSVNETVYNICAVPTTRQTALDSCLLILKDWSNGLSLKAKEIDKERGVVHGEWTMGNGASQRLMEQVLIKAFPNSKYATCSPIGLMSVVDSFPYKALRAYYKKWYRPDNQALVIVGDVDVDHIEAQIHKLFKKVKVPANAAKVVDAETPDNNEAIYAVLKDKEQKTNELSIDMKFDATPDSIKNTVPYYFQMCVQNLISQMFNARLSELEQDANCPFTSSSFGIGSYCGIAKTKNAVSFNARAKEGKDVEALQAMMRELLRVRKFGFTASEYLRAREELLSQIETQYTNRNKRKNDEYCREYIRNFEDGEPIPSVETEYQLANMLLPNVPVDAANELVKEMISDNDTNLVIIETAQDKEGVVLPTEAQLAEAVKAARAEQLTAWVDNAKDEPLIANMPKKGSIKAETENKALGYKALTLSNGATVILKKTDFKDNEIMFRGSAKGGEDQFVDADAENLKLYDSVISSSGLGNFSSLDLQKALAGKQVSVSKSLNVTRHNISGVSTPKDIETMMQLVYLNFTNVSKDQKSYDDLMQRYRLGLKNAEAKPDYIFSDTLVNRIYCGNKKNAVLHLKDLDKVSYDRVLQMDKQLYANAGNFTFYFIGNYDEATLRPLIEQYIASLPGMRSEVKQEETRTYFKGVKNVTFRQKMESPKPIESEIFYGVNTPYTAENKVICSAVGQVLSMDLFQKVREEASATYSIYASCYFNLAGKTPYTLMQIQSPITEDAKVDTALVLIDKVLEKEAQLMTPESVEKVKSVMLKQADVDAKTNGYWLGIISDYLDYGVDNHTDYKKTVRAITPNQLSDFFVKAFYTTGNHLRVVMRPETK